MTIDLWGLGLQAVNVLILVWLLSRVFWRPVAGAIAARQDTARKVTEAARTAQAEADAALAEIAQTRAGIAAERVAVLDAVRAEADTATKATLAEARKTAETLQTTAKTAIEHDRNVAQKANAAQALDLSLDIAAKLLAQMNGPEVQSAFLSQLVEAIGNMPAADRASLASTPKGIKVVSASDPGPEREKIEKALQRALGGSPELRFVTDPALIVGLELHGAHFVLHNSWQADLLQVRKAVKDAA